MYSYNMKKNKSIPRTAMKNKNSNKKINLFFFYFSDLSHKNQINYNLNGKN